MSTPVMRRADRVMPDDETRSMLRRGFAGRLATVSTDGSPYCVPLLYIATDEQLFVHGTNADSHWQRNVKQHAQVCFEVDAGGEVFDYGRFECDSGLAFQSAILFGTMRLVEDDATKQWFYERLMEKYGKPDSIRPKNFFPRLGITSVYAMTIASLTGKECPLPAVAEQWPAKDGTRTPHAVPPA